MVKPFNTAAHTILHTDASRLHGLGFTLMQKPDDSNKMSPIMCGSKSLTDTQANYATVELEALAMLYTCQKCDFYLRGLPYLEIQTDHRPLEEVFNRQMHSMENARLLRMGEILARYNFTVKWTKARAT